MGPRPLAVQLCEGPGGVAPDQRFRVFKSFFERLEGSGAAHVPQGDRHVSEKTRVARPADGAPPSPGAELLGCQPEKGGECLGV